MAKYLIHTDESYAAVGASLERFEGTFHELLLHLVDFEPDGQYENRHDIPVRGADWPEEKLKYLFREANGDGQNYTTVFEEIIDDTVPYGVVYKQVTL